MGLTDKIAEMLAKKIDPDLIASKVEDTVKHMLEKAVHQQVDGKEIERAVMGYLDSDEFKNYVGDVVKRSVNEAVAKQVERELPVLVLRKKDFGKYCIGHKLEGPIATITGIFDDRDSGKAYHGVLNELKEEARKVGGNVVRMPTVNYNNLYNNHNFSGYRCSAVGRVYICRDTSSSDSSKCPLDTG